MRKYERKLTDRERTYISELSIRHPKLAAHNAEVLRTQSYHISGQLKFFIPPNANERTTSNANERPPKKRKRMSKMPKRKDKICGFEMLGKKKD